MPEMPETMKIKTCDLYPDYCIVGEVDILVLALLFNGHVSLKWLSLRVCCISSLFL